MSDRPHFASQAQHRYRPCPASWSVAPAFAQQRCSLESGVLVPPVCSPDGLDALLLRPARPRHLLDTPIASRECHDRIPPAECLPTRNVLGLHVRAATSPRTAFGPRDLHITARAAARLALSQPRSHAPPQPLNRQVADHVMSFTFMHSVPCACVHVSARISYVIRANACNPSSADRLPGTNPERNSPCACSVASH